MPVAFALLTVAGVLVFLAAEKLGSPAARWLSKPLASAGFIAAALANGAANSVYGRWILAALCFCWLGDVLLIPQSTFLAGLGAFLVGHLLFAAAFVVRGVEMTAFSVALLVSALVALPVGRWLLPHVKPKMRTPVVAYIAAISAMVSLAVATHWLSPAPIALVAAFAFYFSDLAVARNRFVQPGWINRLWGLPLYYGAQLLFAWSVK